MFYNNLGIILWGQIWGHILTCASRDWEEERKSRSRLQFSDQDLNPGPSVIATSLLCSWRSNPLLIRIWGSYNGCFRECYLLGCKPRSPLRINRRFGGIRRLHLQVPKISSEETSMKYLANRFFPENGGRMFFRNFCIISTDYTALCQNMKPSHRFSFLQLQTYCL